MTSENATRMIERTNDKQISNALAKIHKSRGDLARVKTVNVVKNRWLMPFGIIGFHFFGRIPVDSSHFSLHFDSILSPKAPKYFILNVLKRTLILAYGPRLTVLKKNVAY